MTGRRIRARQVTGRAGALALTLAAVTTLTGCSDLDRDQARLCRLVAVALLAPGGGAAVLKQRSVSALDAALTVDLPFAGEAKAVETLLTPPPGRAPRPVVCVFGAEPDHRLRLAAVRVGGDPLSLPRLVALQRFWLDDPESLRTDPSPVAGASEAPALPSGAGYAVQQVVGALPGASSTALLAVAYALIYGLTGRVNLAFGAFAANGGAAALLALLGLGKAGVGVALGVGLLAALSAAAHGVAAARLVFRPLRAATGQQVLVATVGLALAIGEALRLAQGPEAHWAGPMLDTPVALARDGAFVVTVTPIALLTGVVALAVGGGLALLMRFSSFGRNWRAFRDDAGAAALFGVGTDRLLAQSFALAAALAGLAGGITVALYGDIPFAYAQGLGLKALTAAVLGGIGSVEGAFLGGLFIGVVEAVWSAAFPVIHRDLVTFAILVAVLVLRPGGFFGERDGMPRRV